MLTWHRRHREKAPPLPTPDEHGGKFNKCRNGLEIAAQRKKLNLVPTEAGVSSEEIPTLTCEYRDSRDASRKRNRTASGDGRIMKWIAFSGLPSLWMFGLRA